MDTIYLVYVLTGVLLVVGFIFYNKFKKIHDLIKNTQTSKITTLKKGFYEIKGKVAKLDEQLESPYSEQPCVYYKFKVEQERSSGKNSHWDTIINDEKFVPFAVEDSSGKAIIDLRNAQLKFYKDVKEKSGFWNSASDNMEQTLAMYGKTSKSWIFEKNLRYHETYLEEGDEVYVIGEVLDFKEYYPVFMKNKLPYIVSDKSEESLLSTYKTIYQSILFGGIVVVLILLYFVFGV